MFEYLLNRCGKVNFVGIHVLSRGANHCLKSCMLSK